MGYRARRFVVVLAPLLLVAVTSANEWAARASSLPPMWRAAVLPLAEGWAGVAPQGELVAAIHPVDLDPSVVSPPLPISAPSRPLPQPPPSFTPSSQTSALVVEPSQPAQPVLVAAPPPEPTTVVAVGDSLMAFVALGLRRGLPVSSQVIDVSRASTGLANAPFYDWPSAAARAVQASHANWLVVHMGANDAQAVKTPTGWTSFGAKGWSDAYASRARLLVEEAQEASPGLEVVWLTMPAMRDRGFDLKMSQVTAAQETVCTLPHVHCVDGRSSLGPDYQKTGRSPSGRLRLWRADDGIHYSAEGGWRLASAIGSQLSWTWKEEASP